MSLSADIGTGITSKQRVRIIGGGFVLAIWQPQTARLFGQMLIGLADQVDRAAFSTTVAELVEPEPLNKDSVRPADVQGKLCLVSVPDDWRIKPLEPAPEPSKPETWRDRAIKEPLL